MVVKNLQYFKEDFWNKQREEFLTKDDNINGILLGQDWNLVGNATANTSISLPSLDTFDEIYVEMFHSEGTIMHQEEFKKESLLFESTNTTHREILLDSIGDTNTYVTYDIENNTITATSIEGNVIDENSTNVFLGVYVKSTSTAEGELGANRVSYDDSVSELGVSDVQGAIEKLDEKIDEKFDNIPSGGTGKSAYDYAKDNGYTGTEEEFAALMNTNFSTTYLTQENPSGSGTFTFDGDAQFTGDVTATDEDGNEISLVDIFESTNNLPSAGTKLIETLPANETTVTFTSDEITENTTLNAVYTSIFGVKLESANVESGVLTLTFDAQEEDMTVVALINATMSDSDETHLGDIDADEVKVDDTNLGLGVTNVQDALEKLKENASGNVKSAYQYAVDGGYEGTEEEFMALLGGLENIGESTPTEGVTEWELVGSVTGTDYITLPNEWEEIRVYVKGSSTSYKTITLNNDLLTDTEVTFNLPTTAKTSSNYCIVSASKTQIKIYSNFEEGTNNASTSTMIIYYKKKSPITVNVGTESNWELWGETTGTTSLALPTDYSELYITMTDTTYHATHYSGTYIKSDIDKQLENSGATETYLYISNGASVGYSAVAYTGTTIKPHFYNSTTPGNNIKTTIYYKKKCDNVLDINDMGEWKLVGNYSGYTNSINISNYRECNIIAHNGAYILQKSFPIKEMIDYMSEKDIHALCFGIFNTQNAIMFNDNYNITGVTGNNTYVSFALYVR